MQFKTEQIVVTLTLDCFHPIGLYSDRVHVIWTTFLALTDKPTLSFGVKNPLEKRFPRTQLSKVNSMPTIRLAVDLSTQAMILQ